MFDFFGYLPSIDLSNFNIQNVYDMCYLFNQRGSWTSLNLSNFNTQNVNDMSFYVLWFWYVGAFNYKSKNVRKKKITIKKVKIL